MINRAWVCSALIIACAAAQNAPRQVTSNDDLDGKWCDARPSYLLCLEVHGSNYAWRASDCSEQGALVDGAVFVPSGLNANGEPLCYAPSEVGAGVVPYRADLSWTSIGLRVDVSGEPDPVYLTYVPELQP